MDRKLQTFFTKRGELSTERGCLLRGSRVLIPSIYHQTVLDELHTEHSGISRTKAFARRYVWGPGMDGEIEAMVLKCWICW